MIKKKQLKFKLEPSKRFFINLAATELAARPHQDLPLPRQLLEPEGAAVPARARRRLHRVPRRPAAQRAPLPLVPRDQPARRGTHDYD